MHDKKWRRWRPFENAPPRDAYGSVWGRDHERSAGNPTPIPPIPPQPGDPPPNPPGDPIPPQPDQPEPDQPRPGHPRTDPPG
jgi:hypothetical protein